MLIVNKMFTLKAENYFFEEFSGKLLTNGKRCAIIICVTDVYL